MPADAEQCMGACIDDVGSIGTSLQDDLALELHSTLQQELPAPQKAGNDEAAKRAAEEEMKRTVLARILDHAARERLARITLVSQERARQIEAIILRMYQMGQITKVTEDQLIRLLEQADDAQSNAQPKKGTIVYQRRKGGFDDDDDF
ncbi:hypothetical protein NM688_g6124 [Phlebia brevispora]|uniref:Uncharacterized protein n=1 Tax=Phlebia brevispora TaxID=194682 RepID=A0ACC1SJI0_9APHY|nr:hypothetical protein NM688_g6124 [Phlebia brevispora]